MACPYIRQAALCAVVLLLCSVASAQTPPGRIGFYQWVGVPPAGETDDLLTAARERTTGLGMGLFRLYLGPRYDYLHPYLSPHRFEGDAAGERTPAEILQIPRYAAVMDDPALETVILTVYTALDYGGGPDDLNLLRPWTETEEAAETMQIEALCDLLYERWGESGKTVILANHEADEKLMEILNHKDDPEQAITTLAAWTNTRHEAIAEARKRHPGAKLRVLHAFEIAAVNLHIRRDQWRYRKSAREGGYNALEDILPRIRSDLVSYSAYESVNSPYETQSIGAPPDDVARRLMRDLDRIRSIGEGSISPLGRTLFASRFVMIGELGLARERFEAVPSGGVLPRFEAAFEAARNWGCPYITVWQAFDAPRRGAEPWGFGAFDSAGSRPALKPGTWLCASIADCLAGQVEKR
jgi:hypothetical protein